MHKPKAEMESTNSSKIYKAAQKRYLDGREISCSICPYHHGENAHKYQRSWKKTRKHQYKS